MPLLTMAHNVWYCFKRRSTKLEPRGEPEWRWVAGVTRKQRERKREHTGQFQPYTGAVQAAFIGLPSKNLIAPST